MPFGNVGLVKELFSGSESFSYLTWWHTESAEHDEYGLLIDVWNNFLTAVINGEMYKNLMVIITDELQECEIFLQVQSNYKGEKNITNFKNPA